MSQDDTDPKFRELLLTLRAYYAYLKCGQFIMKEIFLWLKEVPDITNVENFLLNDCGMTNANYRRFFTATARDIFKISGISKVDITALFRMHQTVNDFFKDTVQPWSHVEYMLNKIKCDRNDIMHTLLMKEKYQNANQLNEYLDSVSDDVDTLIQAFHDQYGGYASEQQRMDLKAFVKKTLDEVRKHINDENMDIQHHGTGNINVTTHGMDIHTAEDAASDLFQQIFGVAGRQGSLSIQHHGTGDINVTQEVYNISGGSHNITI